MFKRVIIFVWFFQALFIVQGICLEDINQKGEVKVRGDHAKEALLVAMVNGKGITKDEYARHFKIYLNKFKYGSSGHDSIKDDDAFIVEEVLGSLVRQELLYQEAMKYIVEGMEMKIDERFESFRNNFPSLGDYTKFLSDSGLDVDGFRKIIAKEAIIDNYVKNVFPSTVPAVSTESARRYYDNFKDKLFTEPEQVEVSQIFIKCNMEDIGEKSQMFEKARLVSAKVLEGIDFSELASEYSDDPAAADNGGNLGYVDRNTIWPPLKEACLSLDVGEVSQVVETSVGFHILKITGKKEKHVYGFDEKSEEIKVFMRSKALEKQFNEKLIELRNSADIEVILPHMVGGE